MIVRHKHLILQLTFIGLLLGCSDVSRITKVINSEKYELTEAQANFVKKEISQCLSVDSFKKVDTGNFPEVSNSNDVGASCSSFQQKVIQWALSAKEVNAKNIVQAETQEACIQAVLNNLPMK